MTKRLEELFDLAPSEPETSSTESTDLVYEQNQITPDSLAAIEKIENALPMVRGLESSDQEMDELANLAKEAFNNLLDLGMQTDPRFSAEIFSVGSTMLGHAITARTAKINKKLKMIDLQLKKAELDRKLAAGKSDDPDVTPLGTGEIVDRNMLMKMIFDNAAAKNDKKDK